MDSNTLTTAQRLSDLGKLDKAIALLEPHLCPPFTELDDLHCSALFALTGLYLSVERYKEGEALVKAALTVAGPEHHSDLYRRLSHFYEARGHTQKASEMREKTAQAEELLTDPGSRAFARVIRLSQEHNPDATYASALQALEALPEDRVAVPWMLAMAAATAFDAGRDSDAWSWASKALVHKNANADHKTDAMRIKALVLGVQGRSDESLDRLKEATYLARQGADWHTVAQIALQTARNLLLRGRVGLAEELTRDVAATLPYARARALSQLVTCACVRGALDEAEALMKEAIAATHKRATTLSAQISLDSAREDYPQTLKHTNEQLRSLGGRGKYLTRVGRVSTLWRAGQETKALEEAAELRAQRWESASQEQQAALARMEARLASLQEDWQTGVAQWKNVLRLEPHPINQPENWVMLGDCYGKLGENSAARFAWERAAALPAESIWVRRANERLELSES
jgi:tetratricopeptide (TPR) repeat protein